MAALGLFAEFTNTHPLYGKFHAELSQRDRRAALSAGVVHALYPSQLDLAAEPLLGWLLHRYGPQVVQMYADRLRVLEGLQKRFDSAPGRDTIGAPDTKVDRDNYNVALLMSIIFSNHRFEIMQQLELFLRKLKTQGRLAILGTGTGYELKLVAEILPEWSIESYDTDVTSEREARGLLQYFGINHSVQFRGELPMDAPGPERRYDAILACEVMEHLPDPGRALRSLREYLPSDGRMFVTMAVNIAQEDHVFWYPNVRACREQLHDSGWKICSEWITPQSTLPPSRNRESRFTRGNYVAEIAPSSI